MTDAEPAVVESEQPAVVDESSRVALLLDSENLFYNFGLWLDEYRFGYRKHLFTDGLGAAVQVTVDRTQVRALAERSLRCCVVWTAWHTGRSDIDRISFGKEYDPGVVSIERALTDLDFTRVHVKRGADKAERALIREFKSLRSSIDTFVFGGEDHLVREEVKDYLHKTVLRFAFIVPEQNFGALEQHELTPVLTGARVALLAEPNSFTPHLPELLAKVGRRPRFYAGLCEVVAETSSALKADPRTPPVRAPQPPATETPDSTAPTDDMARAQNEGMDAPAGRPTDADDDSVADSESLPTQVSWHRIAVALATRVGLKRPTIETMQSPAWRRTLRTVLHTNAEVTAQVAERIHHTFTTNAAAAASWDVRNAAGEAEADSGWRTQLAAAVLLPEIAERGVPNLDTVTKKLRPAYRRARIWHRA